MEFIDLLNGIGINLDVILNVCLLIGFILIIVEMFYPGFGAPGIIGGILLLVGVILTAQSAAEALYTMSIILAIMSIILVIVLELATK